MTRIMRKKYLMRSKNQKIRGGRRDIESDCGDGVGFFFFSDSGFVIECESLISSCVSASFLIFFFRSHLKNMSKTFLIVKMKQIGMSFSENTRRCGKGHYRSLKWTGPKRWRKKWMTDVSRDRLGDPSSLNEQRMILYFGRRNDVLTDLGILLDDGKYAGSLYLRKFFRNMLK